MNIRWVFIVDVRSFSSASIYFIVAKSNINNQYSMAKIILGAEYIIFNVSPERKRLVRFLHTTLISLTRTLFTVMFLGWVPLSFAHIEPVIILRRSYVLSKTKICKCRRKSIRAI